ncbi:MAG: L-methionine gamma-lyase [Steroidobacteraceae bacterium]|nr:L-methionine gamma-lyase [Steroidobacteraceae bacterium]
MSYDQYHKRRVGKHELHPETQMMGYGYDPQLSEGSLKPPVFLTSTFVFRTAEEGKAFFDYTSGRREAPPGQGTGLVYSRFNNPNLEVLEDRLALWEGGEAAAVFASGMAAISTTILAHVRPGDVILMSLPLYGGTETLIEKTLPNLGIRAVGFTDGCSERAVMESMEEALRTAKETGGRIAFIMTETPANPTNSLVDLALMRRVADEIARRQGGEAPPVAVDNTFLGPVYQQPLKHGADLVLYSLTKYVGGHSDLVAGGLVGSKARIRGTRLLRSALGTQLDPNSAWMIMRSMETMSLRMRAANDNAARVAAYLARHPRVSGVNWLGLLADDDPRTPVFRRQCTGAGSTFAFRVGDSEADAFRMLNRLQVMKLAVSLGGTETLVSHPASTTHSGVPKATRDRYGITDAVVRISVGVEHPDDLIADLEQALG